MADLNKFLLVGDTFTTAIQEKWNNKYGSEVQFYAKDSRTATQLKTLLKKDSDLPEVATVNGVVLLIGIYDILKDNNKDDVIECIKLLKKKYKNIKIYVQRVFPVCSKYDEKFSGGWTNINSAVKTLNLSVKQYCDSIDGIYYIDTTRGFSNNAVLVESKTNDGLHIADQYLEDYINNIINAVDNITNDNTADLVGAPCVMKKLLPEALADKSFTKSGFDQKYIVIHNTNGKSNQLAYNYWASGADGTNASAHYCVQDNEIWQVCEDTWVAYHVGIPNKNQPGGKAGVTNANAFGIEMSDSDAVDKEKALDNTIELTRYLMQTYDIPLKNIYQHYEVNGVEPKCPAWIIDNKKWDYFLKEIENRNKENTSIKLNFSTTDTTTSNTGSTPDFDNREDLINIDTVKGVVLVHMPPYHFYSKKNKDSEWTTLNYDRNFHFEVDSAGFKTKVDNNLITWGMQPNDRHTYIDRALFKNKPYKYVLNIGLFTSDNLSDYTVTEKILIDRIGKVLWDNGLETKDLWREFDLNRAPSPFMYLEREQWKKFLREVDKQVKWRYENFGTPPVIKDKEEQAPLGESHLYKENIGKQGITKRKCSLWKNPEENISTRLKILEQDVAIKILEYNDNGMYKVEVLQTGLVGWIWLTSITVEAADVDTYSLVGDVYVRAQSRTGEGTEDSDPVEDKTGEKNIPQPEILPTMTHEEYLKWKAFTDPKYIDNFAGECEPYDKGLDEILNAPITDDDRLVALTEKLDTRNENTIYFNCVEGSPGGDGSHCAKNANELNMLIKPDPYNVDPIYPDLIIPPNYSTADYNIQASNALPLTVLQDDNGTIQNLEDYDSNDLFFDYNLLKDAEKKSKGKPVNYLDPYPYDDKIYELENHKPKVKIDEIEARMYDSNHPGDPIAHPIAKNFANVYDMAINQSKKIESRLVRIENTLATVLRNLGRIGSRININCVYYGGQDVFGKYKTIRCMRDDRIHDAGSMTLDQCLCCTRYEPIVGQIYEILDDTGVNGSVMLDNMQMSYMDLDDMKNLNRVEQRNSTKKFVNVNREEKETPQQIHKEWEEADKERYINSLKETVTNETELNSLINSLKQEDYSFKMNWLETDLDLQEPDVKVYPTEGIKAKYKAQQQETPLQGLLTDNVSELVEQELASKIVVDEELIDDTDLDYQEDLEKLEQLNQGEWVDTREEADTFEKNAYTSEDYFFEGFNSDNASFSADGGNSSFSSEARDKILEMAKKIVQDHNDGKACYSQAFRTNDYTKPVYGYDKKISQSQIVGYDCSSFVSCCYNHAGLKEITNKTTISIYDYAISNKNSGAKVWEASKDTLSQAKPGDIIVTKGQGHTGIYMGNDQFAHAATNSKGPGQQIRIDSAENFLKYSIPNGVFLRPADLVKADEQAAATNSGGTCPSNTQGPAIEAPSNAILRFIKGQEGWHRVGDYYNGESWRTGGYGVTERWSKANYDSLKPFPTPDDVATKSLIKYLQEDSIKGIIAKMKSNNLSLSQVKQHQLDALMSIAMNAGIGGLTKSAAFKAFLKNPNDPSIPDLIKTTCAPSKSHKERRAIEAAIYSKGVYQFKSITIWDGAGKAAGVVTENNGHGWLPGNIE